MRLLVLGGSGFVGGAVVAEAASRGWDVTVFNRGIHGSVPDGVRRLRGDRETADGLDALAGGAWDAVVDTWDGAPDAVWRSARAVEAVTPHYVYVSSRSVYRVPPPPDADETAPTVDPGSGDSDYASHKAGGEAAVREVFGDSALIARAGLILGPGEDIGRLPWWLRRAERGGEMLAPGPADLRLQLIDARDLAAWLLDRAATHAGGVFNAVSRPGHATMGEVLDACVAVTGGRATLRWMEPEPILAAGVVPWNDLPLWIPEGHEFRWLHTANADRAAAAGLRCRPVAETVADTWDWLRSVGELPSRAGRPARPKVGLDPAVEAAILRG